LRFADYGPAALKFRAPVSVAAPRVQSKRFVGLEPGKKKLIGEQETPAGKEQSSD
jgi:hypothetical protein